MRDVPGRRRRRISADLLDRLMRGERLDRDEWLLPPVGISTWQSTDVLVIDDAVAATPPP